VLKPGQDELGEVVVGTEKGDAGTVDSVVADDLPVKVSGSVVKIVDATGRGLVESKQVTVPFSVTPQPFYCIGKVFRID